MRFLDAFYIRDKRGKKVLYKRGPAQQHYAQNSTSLDYILKARQLGFTTEKQLNYLEKVMYYNFITCATISHKKKSAEKIFRIGKFAWDNLDEKIKSQYGVKYDNVRELLFEVTNSNYFVDVESRGSTINHLHISEFAFIKNPEDIIASTFETVPKGGTITIETTANGLNHGYSFWQDAVNGKNGFKPHFYNWAWDPDYKETLPEDDSWINEYREMARAYGLILDVESRLNVTREQFYWYYLKARLLKELIKQEYPCTAEEAFLSTGKSVFDLFKLMQTVPKQPIDNRWGVKIFYEPEDKHEYIIGIDTAEGTGGDSTSIEVIDDKELRQVANFIDDKIRPDQAAQLAVKLSELYNKAFIIPERNSSGLTTVLKLQELGYKKRMFRNVAFNKITKKKKDELGWRTTSSNRDMMIDDFVELWEDGNFEINSEQTISQMKSFVRKENGKREHEDGKNDDSLFGLFLAVQGRKYNRSSKRRAFANKPIGL